MTTEYAIKKIQSFGFARDLESFNERFTRDNRVYVLSSRWTEVPNESYIMLQSIDELSSVEKNDSVIVIDLECDIFSDIHISMPKIQKAGESSKDQQISKEEMQEQLSGKSTSLDAFSNNLFAVIYGKKGANIQSCNTKQNHGVLDSLARNGVVCTPKTQNVLSFQRIIDYLKKLNRFSVFGVHSALELSFDEQEYPSEISHPSYKLANGEITAILYRYVLINFYGYCSIVTDSMRENAYIF
jgi:hypothetical protein